MARATLVKSVAPGPWPTDGVVLTETAANVADKNQFVNTGKELLIARNTDPADPYTVTINSTANRYGRTGDITGDSLAAGVVHIYGPFAVDGWNQAGTSYIYLEASNAAITFAVVTLP
jgi:hypothetical protein